MKGLVLFVGKRSKTWYFQNDVGGPDEADPDRALSGGLGRGGPADGDGLLARHVARSGQGGADRSAALKDAIETYLARPKLRSETHKHEFRRQLHLHLRDWLRLPLDEISKRMVVERHRALEKVPSSANHTLRRFRAVWNNARRTHDLPECPTMALDWYEEAPDGRVIDDLTEWRRTVDGLYNPIHSVYFRLLLFTGLRKTESLTLEWKHVHKDRIHLPVTKNERSFDLPIVDLHQGSVLGAN